MSQKHATKVFLLVHELTIYGGPELKVTQDCILTIQIPNLLGGMCVYCLHDFEESKGTINWMHVYGIPKQTNLSYTLKIIVKQIFVIKNCVQNNCENICG